jgi:hypothetical protein
VAAAVVAGAPLFVDSWEVTMPTSLWQWIIWGVVLVLLYAGLGHEDDAEE